jgi:hypothetical protein
MKSLTVTQCSKVSTTMVLKSYLHVLFSDLVAASHCESGRRTRTMKLSEAVVSIDVIARGISMLSCHYFASKRWLTVKAIRRFHHPCSFSMSLVLEARS